MQPHHSQWALLQPDSFLHPVRMGLGQPWTRVLGGDTEREALRASRTETPVLGAVQGGVWAAEESDGRVALACPRKHPLAFPPCPKSQLGFY